MTAVDRPITPGTVEGEAIVTAHAYATANGYAPDDAKAAGLVLVGMALGAALTDAARTELLEGYLRAFPQGEASVFGYALRISRALAT